MKELYRSKISGTGSYLPEQLVTNFDLEKLVDTNDQWIVERTGIKRRHKAADHEACSDLACEAAKKALQDSNLTPNDIDLIIVATVTGDQVMPSTACVLQNKLGCRNIMSFDVTAACSGFVYSLSIADQFIKTGMYKHILVVGAEVLTRIVNYKDRETCILFGDGAGAFIVSRANSKEDNVIMSTHLHADGGLSDLFTLPGGGSKIPFSQRVLDENLQYVTMKGREIFKNAVKTLTLCCHEALEQNKVKSSEVDWLVPHQANMRILQSVADYFEFPTEKVVVSLDETGNTSAASIPVAFDLAVQKGQIKRGQLVLLAAFGAGLTSGSALLRY
jgi:3-oxoacyl-[acyl-carrier-protein] synthase-3